MLDPITGSLWLTSSRHPPQPRANQLQANLAAWGVLDASSGMAGDRRYGSYRAIQLEYVLELNDTTAMRTPPAATVYYPWRVYYGRSYELVFSGSSRQFHAGVKASFKALQAGLEGFAKRWHLNVDAKARGLSPRDETAIFAKTKEEIEARYRQSGEAVPIFVEYRQVPQARVPERPITWVQPVDIELRYTDFQVIRDGSWGSTPWTLDAFCLADGIEVFLDASNIWMRKPINDNRTYNLNWVARLALAPGSRLECGTKGLIADHATSPQDIAVAKMQRPIVVERSMRPVSSTFGNADRKTAYTVAFTLEVVE